MKQQYLMQAIETKYICPTHFKGARVRARYAGGSIIRNWDHALNPEDNHRAAAVALAVKLGWTIQNVSIGGVLPSGNYCFVAVPKRGKKRGKK